MPCSLVDPRREVAAAELHVFSNVEVATEEVEIPQVDDKPVDEGGKFKLLPADDLAADRWVKAINNILIVTFKQKPRL